MTAKGRMEGLDAAAQADHMGTRISVVADAADAYLQISGYQARLACAEGQIAADSHLLILMKLRQPSGVATDREVAQADALTSQARALLPPLKMGLEAQLNRLDVLLGAQAGTYAKELAAAAQPHRLPPSTTGRSMLDVMMPMVVSVVVMMWRRKGRIGEEECQRNESCNVIFAHMNRSKLRT